jgi:hypothetical protein
MDNGESDGDEEEDGDEDNEIVDIDRMDGGSSADVGGKTECWGEFGRNRRSS